MNKGILGYGGWLETIKQDWCGKSHRPLPEGYSEYNHLITRMMDKNQHTRATITEIVKILADIKATKQQV